MTTETAAQTLVKLGFKDVDREGFVGLDTAWGSEAVTKVLENLNTIKDLGYYGIRIADTEYSLHFFESRDVQAILAKRAEIDERIEVLRILEIHYLPEGGVSTGFTLARQINEYLASLTLEPVNVGYSEVSDVRTVSHDRDEEFGKLTLAIQIGDRKYAEIQVESVGGKRVGDSRENLFYRIDIQVLKDLVNS